MAYKLFLLLCALSHGGSEDESIFLQTDVHKPEPLVAVKQPLTNMPTPSQQTNQEIIDEVARNVQKDMDARMTVQMAKIIAQKYNDFTEHLSAQMVFLGKSVDMNITAKFNKDQSPALQYRILETSLREIIEGTHNRLLPGMSIFKDYIAGVFIGLKLAGSPSVGDDWNATMGPVIRSIDTFDHSFVVAQLEVTGVHDLGLEQTVHRVHLVDAIIQEAIDELEITKHRMLEGNINLVREIEKAIVHTVPEDYHSKLNKVFDSIVEDTDHLITKVFHAIRETDETAHARVDEALVYLGAKDEDLYKHHSAGVKFGLGLAAFVLGVLAF